MSPAVYIDGVPSIEPHADLYRLTLPGVGGAVELLLTTHAVLGLQRGLEEYAPIIRAVLDGRLTSSGDVVDFQPDRKGKRQCPVQ